MAKEEVELMDGSKVEVNVRPLVPRKAFQIVQNAMKITEMQDAGDNENQVLKGDFSGIVGLIPKCFDEIVQECPQKDEISVKSMKELYDKYASKTIQEVMTSVGQGVKKN